MVTLINDSSQRAWSFPMRMGPDGKAYRAPVLDAPAKGAPAPKIEVPDWYFAALLAEKGLKPVFNRRRDGISVTDGGTKIALPSEAEIEARLSQAAKAARSAEARAAAIESDLSARIAELEARLKAAATADAKTDDKPMRSTRNG
jgi:hypothetical protein